MNYLTPISWWLLALLIVVILGLIAVLLALPYMRLARIFDRFHIKSIGNLGNMVKGLSTGTDCVPWYEPRDGVKS